MGINIVSDISAEKFLTILKKSTWYLGLVSVVSYGLGAACWSAAEVVNHHKALFGSAALCFAVGFIWSSIWLWNSDFFKKPHRRHRRRYSDLVPNEHSDIQSHEYAKTHVERRRRKPKIKKGLRGTVIFCLSLLFVGINVGLFLSYQAEIADVTSPKIEIFIVGPDMVRAMRIPSFAASDHTKDMEFALSNVPSMQHIVQNGEKTIKINVVLRNPGEANIRNAHLKIYSDVHIVPGDEKLRSVSDTEIDGDVLEVPRYWDSWDERSFPVEIPVPDYRPQAGILVSLEGTGVQPYAAVAKIVLVRKP